MKNKTIVSLDLWRTLIKSSPSFQKEKCDLIKAFTSWSIPNEDISMAFARTKKSLDYVIERTGWQPNLLHIWQLFFNHIEGVQGYLPKHNKFEDFINNLSNEYYKIAIKNLPSLYEKDTRQFLEKLSFQYQLVLSSNTLFLPSFVLREYLKKLNIDHYFSKLNFSCDLGVSKPNVLMYGGSKYHIGDNLWTDWIGPKRYGIDAFLINKEYSHKTIKDGYEYINYKENKNGITSVFSS